MILPIVSVVVSVSALAFTFYLNVYRERRLRPRLSLRLPDGRPGPDLLTFTYASENGCAEHWLRLRVENEPRRRTAENVEVLFIGCAADDDTSDDLPLDWRRLRWSATSELQHGVDVLSREASKPELETTVPPGFFRHVDVIHASNRAKVAEDLRGVPRICVWPTTSDRNNLGEGSYRLFFAITARDADATFYSTRVTYDGAWSADKDEWWTQRMRVEKPSKVAATEVPGGI